MNLEDLARQAGLIEAVDFRRERGQQLTAIEQRGLDGLMLFGRLVRDATLEEAAQACRDMYEVIDANSDLEEIARDHAISDCIGSIRALKSTPEGRA